MTSHWSHVITRPPGRCEATHADPGDNAAVKRKKNCTVFIKSLMFYRENIRTPGTIMMTTEYENRFFSAQLSCASWGEGM